MNTYLISDIHGNNSLFRKALKSINFKKTDRLIILGDMIDRGEDSKGVIDTIFLMIEAGLNVTCLKGNHEQMMIDSLKDTTAKVTWMKNGGKDTLKSFSTSKIEPIPSKYIGFLKNLKPYLIIENFIMVHAGINMKIDKPLSDEYSLLWLRNWEDVFDENWLGNRIVIHGHSPIAQDEIIKQVQEKRNVICIDNGNFVKNKDGYGSICILKLEDLSLYFVNENS
ncbi:MAG: metallophosphoesterase family protein [Patiriisocius sp.]|uniref:metallophosphoesterase family protein n=1 Tax=Patiriisocius sp. TaxID=2822396 RepID=UPI003EF5B1AE